MAASNKRRKKLARELQARTGLRYTDALDRVRLRTTKEEGMQVAENSPLVRAIQKQKSKLALEAPEAEALRPKVEEAVRAVLSVLSELPIRDGMRGISGYEDNDGNFMYGSSGLRQIGHLDEVQIVLGRSSRMGKSGDDRMQLWLNGPMSVPMDRVPETVAVSVGGSIEDPSSWIPDLADLGLRSLRTAMQICTWLTGPEMAGSKASSQEVFGDDELLPEELVSMRARRLARIEHKRRSLLSQVEEVVYLGVSQVPPSTEVILEGVSGNGGSWGGEICLESDTPEKLFVVKIDIEGRGRKTEDGSRHESVFNAGPDGRGFSVSCFKKGAEPAIHFRNRKLPRGSKIQIRVKNLDDKPHAITGSIRTLPNSSDLSAVLGDDDLG